MLKFSKKISRACLSVGPARSFSRSVFRKEGYKYAKISPFRDFYLQNPHLVEERTKVFETIKTFPIEASDIGNEEYEALSRLYLEKASPEFEHIENDEEREWLYE